MLQSYKKFLHYDMKGICDLRYNFIIYHCKNFGGRFITYHDKRAQDVISLFIMTEISGTEDYYFFFFKLFFKCFFGGGHMCPILGPLVPLFCISSDVSSGFQSQSGLPYSHCGGEHNVCFLRSTSGSTHASLLAASLPPVRSSHTVAEVRLPGFEVVLPEYLWVRCSTNWAKLGWALLIMTKISRTEGHYLSWQNTPWCNVIIYHDKIPGLPNILCNTATFPELKFTIKIEKIHSVSICYI